MRIVVTIGTDKLPELHQALASVPARSRAARLTLLATLGLTVLSDKSIASPAVEGLAPPPPGNPPEAGSTPGGAADVARGLKLRAKLAGKL